MRARRIRLPGMGDDYAWLGRAKVTINEHPANTIAAEEPGVRGALTATNTAGPIGSDPVLDHERALIGGLILGELETATVDAGVAHPSHPRIVEALAGEYIGSAEVAIQLCRAAKLPSELVGRIEADTALGYLAGCVRSWREKGAVA